VRRTPRTHGNLLDSVRTVRALNIPDSPALDIPKLSGVRALYNMSELRVLGIVRTEGPLYCWGRGSLVLSGLRVLLIVRAESPPYCPG
jgi:hypothetical protein